MQRQLEANNYAGEKQRQHHHYLKGSVFCGKIDNHGNECGCRLIVTNAKSRSKTVYPYFICIGRQRDTTSCKQRALPIIDVEQAICDFYMNVELSEDLRLQTEQKLLEQITELRERTPASTGSNSSVASGAPSPNGRVPRSTLRRSPATWIC